MLFSPSHISALKEMAELAGSQGPAEERLQGVLRAARKALGLDALCVVACRPASGESREWHSADPGFELDTAAIESEALSFLDGAHQTVAPRRFIVPAPTTDGCRIAVVGDGDCDTDAARALLQVSASYISVLIENGDLARACALSDSSVGRRMEELAAIYEIGQAIESTDIDPLLDMIVAKAAAVMDAQACSLMLRSPTDGALTIAASYGLADDIVKGARLNVGEGIAGRVAETGTPMLICDVASDSRFKGGVRPKAGVICSMCVPLRDENGIVSGVLNIRRHAPNPPFTDDDLKLFCVFGIHAALAMSNTHLYTRLLQKIQEMSTISDIMRAINSTLDLDHVLYQIAESITTVVGFDRCCVYLLDSRTNEFVASARRGYGPEDRIRARVKLDEGVVGLAAREQIPIFSHSSPVEGESGEQAGEYLVAPIVVRDACIGVVLVDNCLLNRRIESQNVDLLATFVTQAGIAVENARLYEAMEEKYAELNVLYEQSKSISAASGLDSAAETLVHTASRAARCDGAGLLLLDARRDRLHLQASRDGLTRCAPEIERLAEQERCVAFVRDLRAPRLIAADDPERMDGPNADLLNALAPAKANLMLVPLVTEDTTIGTLVLYRGRPEDFQGAEFQLVSIVASHASTVLKNALTYDMKMRQRVLELTALYEFSKRISSAASLEEALDSILAIVADLVDYDESFIYAIDHERAVASVKASRFRGGSGDPPSDESLDGLSVTSWAIMERKALVSPDIGKDRRFREFGKGRGPVRSLMSIPLIVQDEVVGVLSVSSYSPNQYSEDDVRVLSIIASQGAAIYKELEALTALTSYTDNILSSIAAGVVTLGSDGMVLTWNNAAENITGVLAGRVKELHYSRALAFLGISAEDKAGLRRAIDGVLQTGETYQGYKVSFHPKDVEDIYVNMSISQLLNSSGEQLGLVVIFEDVTREIRMEDEFRRMGELAAVGQLAASIAHELRNPLSSIKGAAQFLQKEYEDQGPIVEFLEIIIEEVNGLNKLTTEFLDFARPMQLELKPTSVNAIVDKTLQLMSVHITDNNVVVKESLDPNVPEIRADERQLEQVLKNVFINALQAMPDGGILTVETGPTPSGGACMTVTDTGVGISEDKLASIFIPFFTTKTKGTGLGLSVVQKIIENHGGRTEVVSRPGAGTTFKFILPHTGHAGPVAQEVDQSDQRRMSGELRGGE